jgi:hypothetical protein
MTAGARSMPGSRPEKRNRKAKDDAERVAKLPSVPSTQHMAGDCMYFCMRGNCWCGMC